MKASKAFIKHFDAPQRSVKIKIYVNFFSSPGIGTGRVNSPGIMKHLSFDRKLFYCMISTVHLIAEIAVFVSGYQIPH